MIEIVGLLVAVVLLIYVLIRRRRNRKHEMVLMRARARLRGYVLDLMPPADSNLLRLVVVYLRILGIYGSSEVEGSCLILRIGPIHEVDSGGQPIYWRCSFSLLHPRTFEVVGEGEVKVRFRDDRTSLRHLVNALVREIINVAGRLE